MLMPEMVTQIFAIAAIFIVQAKSNENTQTYNINETISQRSLKKDIVINGGNHLLTVHVGKSPSCPSTINLYDFEKGKLAMKNIDSGKCLVMDITERIDMLNDKERSKDTYQMKDEMIVEVFPVKRVAFLQNTGTDILHFCKGYNLLFGKHIEQIVDLGAELDHSADRVKRGGGKIKIKIKEKGIKLKIKIKQRRRKRDITGKDKIAPCFGSINLY